MGISLRALLIAGLFGQVSLSLHAQQLLDDFNRPASTTVGGGWTEVETTTGEAQINGSGQLSLSSTTAGRDYIWQDVDGFYGTTLNTNSCLLTWAFCIRQSRTDPSGFNSGSYGAAFVLGASGTNFTAGTTGYAVLFGQSGASDPLRLVRFSNGLSSDGVLTNVIAAAATPTPFNDLSTHYLAVRVTYAPTTGTWTMYASQLSAGTFSTTDPLTASTQVGSATVNTTYVGNNLRYIGCFWNHSTTGTDAALFDNITIPQLCIPIVNFTTSTALVNENVGGVLVTMDIFPATVTGGNIVVTVTNGLGVVYGAGNDYTTTPAVVGSDITIPVAPGATSASFTILVNDELVDEDNEVITFSISSTTGDLILGADLTYEITIIDDDGGPTVNFTTTSITVLENGGVQTFFLSISPPPVVAGNVTISVTNGPGVTCAFGQDYIVTGIGCP
ncbi:MAG: hypothetical protein KDB95_12555, partial [Flavobacteriales bacterium]|nr:hypothetical protein [Flavobacteriales bacterium]